ncbi:MAG: hypothetical protein ACOY15_09005 [Pseudomonadota bacterium]
MPNTRKTSKTPLALHRSRMKRRGIVRVEVQVRKEDVALVRDIAHALNSPDQADAARALLRTRFAAGKAQGLKALLASAPLEGIDIKRTRDTGRNIDL